MVTSGIDEVLQRKWPPEHSYSCYIGIRAHPTPPAASFRASILKRLFDEAKSKSIIIRKDDDFSTLTLSATYGTSENCSPFYTTCWVAMMRFLIIYLIAKVLIVDDGRPLDQRVDEASIALR